LLRIILITFKLFIIKIKDLSCMLIFLILFKCVYINGLVIIKTLGSILIFVERVWIFLKIKTGI